MAEEPMGDDRNRRSIGLGNRDHRCELLVSDLPPYAGGHPHTYGIARSRRNRARGSRCAADTNLATRRHLRCLMAGGAMSPVLLYFILLKATITAFSGLSSLPVIRHELVVNRHVITDAQISSSMVAGRISPGPLGMFIVSLGYYVAGIPGAIAAWL